MSGRIKASDLMTEEYRLRQMGAYSPTPIQVGEEKGFLMVDNNGFVMPRDQFIEFVKKANVAYESEGIEEFIRFENFSKIYPIFSTTLVDGKNVLPTPHYAETTFRKDIKKDWGFKCAWCETKVSSKTDTHYFYMRASLDEFGGDLVEGKFCQEACAENYWYEQVIEFVMDKKMTDYIHTDKRITR